MAYAKTASMGRRARSALRKLGSGMLLTLAALHASNLSAGDLMDRGKAEEPDKFSVELRAFDGSAVITGRLAEVSHGAYAVETPLGLMRIAIADAECIGIACPDLDDVKRDFSIFDATGNFKAMVPALLEGYADYIGADFQDIDVADGAHQVSIIDQAKGIRLASIDYRTARADGSFALMKNAAGIVAAAKQESGDHMRLFLGEDSGTDAEEGGPIPISLDGIAVIVHPDNPVQKLDPRTIADLFSCKRRNWGELGGPNGPVRLYVRDADSDVYESFRALILERYGVELCDEAEIVATDSGLAGRVTLDKFGVGFVNLGDSYSAKPLAIRTCGINYRPTAFNAKVGEYPLVRQVFLQAPPLGKSSAATQSFIDFALSNPGQSWLEQRGLVDLRVESTFGDATIYRLAKLEAASRNSTRQTTIERLVEATGGAYRLSTTFRFDFSAGSLGHDNRLDVRSERDLSRLASYLVTRPEKDLEVLVFGFADAVGGYDDNLALSNERAQAVADKLAFLGIPISEVIGFGEEAPVACNDHPEGRAKNRRVEVWLRT